MRFYHDLTTDQSFKFLQRLKKDYDFILIGGWAVYLYSHSLKSKDIDVIVDYDELAKMKENYDVFKNDRLKKYEIKTGEFDVDIYLPHYSDLGVDIEKIKINAIVCEGFRVPELETLLLLKFYAYESRRGSIKGQKDELDIFSLAFLPEFDWAKYKNLINESGFSEYHNQFLDLLKRTTRVEELEINDQKMARIRKSILKKIE